MSQGCRVTIFLGPLRCRCGVIIAATKGDMSWHNSTKAGKLHGFHRCAFTHHARPRLTEALLMRGYGMAS